MISEYMNAKSEIGLSKARHDTLAHSRAMKMKKFAHLKWILRFAHDEWQVRQSQALHRRQLIEASRRNLLSAISCRPNGFTIQAQTSSGIAKGEQNQSMVDVGQFLPNRLFHRRNRRWASYWYVSTVFVCVWLPYTTNSHSNAANHVQKLVIWTCDTDRRTDRERNETVNLCNRSAETQLRNTIKMSTLKAKRKKQSNHPSTKHLSTAVNWAARTSHECQKRRLPFRWIIRTSKCVTSSIFIRQQKRDKKLVHFNSSKKKVKCFRITKYLSFCGLFDIGVFSVRAHSTQRTRIPRTPKYIQ